MKKKRDRWITLTMVPIYAFTIIFVVFPLVYMVILSFLSRAEVWGVVMDVTLDNYKKIWEPLYLNTFKESLKLAFLSTGVIILLGYPFGYYMGQLSEKWKKRMLESCWWIQEKNCLKQDLWQEPGEM